MLNQSLANLALILQHDVDLVCINQAYVHTDRRLDAVELMHRNLTVGIRYLHEHDETKVCQIEQPSYMLSLNFRTGRAFS